MLEDMNFYRAGYVSASNSSEDIYFLIKKYWNIGNGTNFSMLCQVLKFEYFNLHKILLQNVWYLGIVITICLIKQMLNKRESNMAHFRLMEAK